MKENIDNDNDNDNEDDNEDDDLSLIKSSSTNLKLDQEIILNNEQNKDLNISKEEDKRDSLNLKEEERKSFYIDEEERLTLSHDLKEIQSKSFFSLENILKLGTKIRCPNKDCFSKSIIYLNPFFFEINSDCGKHKNKMNIIEYVKNSGISKENKEICFNCKKNYQYSINNNKNFYKCSCGKNICQSCEDFHLKDNSVRHNVIDFKVKDYTCYCNDRGEKFIGYCFDCNKNYCVLCNNNHNNHKKKQFDEFNIDINLLERQLNEQKKTIKKFNSIMDNWLGRVKEFIEIYKKKIELYGKINEIIIKQYASNNNCYKSIKNIEYINFDFDDFVINIIKNQYNMKYQNTLIYMFLNECMKNYLEVKKKNKVIIKNLSLKESRKLNFIVNNICEMKKKEMLIINGIDKNANNNEQLLVTKMSTDYKLRELYCTGFESNKILSLSELKSGNLLMVQANQFKILEINDVGCFKGIQTAKLNDFVDFKEVIELSNGYLVSISLDSVNEIIFWKKNLFNGNYEIEKRIKKDKAISILEYNISSFLIYCYDDNMYSFNSITGKETKKGKFYTVYQKKLEKMMNIRDNCVLLIFKECIGLINLSTLVVSHIFKIFNDVGRVPISNNIFLASISEKKKKSKNGICVVECNTSNNELICNKIFENSNSDIINIIYPLKNRDIITFSSEKNLRVWSIIEE